MYSIVQLCAKGKKIRYASNNLEEIYKIYNHKYIFDSFVFWFQGILHVNHPDL